jgi:hypothetical protein
VAEESNRRLSGEQRPRRRSRGPFVASVTLPRIVVLAVLVCAMVLVNGASAKRAATADLEVSFITVGDPAQRTAGAPFSVRIGIGNNGPDSSHVRLRLLLPAGIRLVEGAPLGCTGTSDLSCEAVDAPSGYNVDGRVTVVADAPGSYTFVARLVELTATDSNPANNEASLTVKVVRGRTPVARTLVASSVALKPARPRAGSPFTVSLGITDGTSGRGVVPAGARCSASLGRARARVVSRRAACTVTTPARAAGKTLRGVLTAIVGDRRLSKRFSIRLR